MRILCPVVLRHCKLAEIRPIPVSSDSMPGKVIVYGGRGGLGVVVVSTFRQAGYEVLYCMYCTVLYRYEVLSVDIVANTEAEHNVLVSLDTTWPGQEEQVCRGVEAALAVSQAGNMFYVFIQLENITFILLILITILGVKWSQSQLNHNQLKNIFWTSKYFL